MENLKIKSVYQFDKNEIEYLNEKYNITKIIAVCFLDRTKFTLDEKGNVSISGEAAYGAFDKEQWKDVKRIVNGKKHIVGLKNDGTVVAYGDNSNGQCNVADWKNVVSVDIDNDNTIGFTKSHVMLETKKEEVILPEVQIPTTDDTEKEKAKPLEPYSKTDNKEKSNKSNFKTSAKVDNISNKATRKPNTKAVIIAIIAVLVVAGAVGAVVAGNSNSMVKNNESSLSSSKEADYEGKCGDNTTYKLIGNTLYIEGTGSVEGSYYGNPFENLVSNKIKRVVISDGVTEIGDYAFYGCSSLESITIPSSVTEIGKCAFRDCTSLESITIPSSVTKIEYGAFCGCSSLESITIPSSVTKIGSWAFDCCTSLESITIPSSVTKIGYGAFFHCTSLESITIPSSVTEIGDSAFGDCKSLEDITIPSSVTEIGSDAFLGCGSLTIQGKAGSYSERYAKENDINFESI